MLHMHNGQEGGLQPLWLPSTNVAEKQNLLSNCSSLKLYESHGASSYCITQQSPQSAKVNSGKLFSLKTSIYNVWNSFLVS